MSHGNEPMPHFGSPIPPIQPQPHVATDRIGRHMTDAQARELTFPIAIDRMIMWLIAGLVSTVVMLVGWLCLQQQEQGKLLVKMDERSQATKEQMIVFHTELERLTIADNRLSLELKRLQLQAAEHGWKGMAD